MPTSKLGFAPEILGLVAQVPHARVLDVGPGHGKYAVLLREYVPMPVPVEYRYLGEFDPTHPSEDSPGSFGYLQNDVVDFLGLQYVAVQSISSGSPLTPPSEDAVTWAPFQA